MGMAIASELDSTAVMMLLSARMMANQLSLVQQPRVCLKVF